jgi:antibiotic biosynthesis monooxygenase (ABM) superfamily enzyme
MKANEPVTVLFSRTAKPGQETAYESWNQQLIRLSEKQPGHVMTSVVADGDRRYITLQRFETHQAMQRWMDSPEHKAQLDQLSLLTEDAPEPAEMTGMETWFRLPGQSGRHIPRWKMVLTTFCVIYIFIVLLNIFLVPRTAHLPLPVRAAVFPVIMTPLMTYIVMPRVTRWFSGWLYD